MFKEISVLMKEFQQNNTTTASKLRLGFILTTPGNDVPWNVEASYLLLRSFTYLLILGTFVVILYKILKYFDESELEINRQNARTETESDPIMPAKEQQKFSYGTAEEDSEANISFFSQDLYEGNICVICYDQSRKCFFTPCGHYIACYPCAHRIMKEESKLCPICRRLIQKVRRLPSF